MKTPLLLLGICASFYGTAQTIELADTISAGNSMDYFVLDSNANAYSAVIGAGSVWDYSEVGGYGLAANTNDVIMKDASTFATDFPTATYAENFENGVNTFFTNDPTNNQVIVHGFVFQELASDYIIKYDSDPLISYKFPMNLGDSYTDDLSGTAVLPGVGDVDISGEAVVTADGTGTLKVGDVEYTNVIRVHTVENTSGLIVVFGTTLSVTRESYVYYDIDNFNMPIFIHASIIAEVGVAGTFGFTAVYSRDEVSDYVNLISCFGQEFDFNVYPNPATGDFVTITNPEEAESMTILNALGEVVYTVNAPSMTETINVANLANGIYFVQTTKAGTTKTLKFIVK